MEKISAWAYIYKANNQLTNVADIVGPLTERRGVDRRSIFGLFWMKRLEPEITQERFLWLAPYSHPDRIGRLLKSAIEQGLIQSAGAGNQYLITELGSSIIDEINETWVLEVSSLEPMSTGNLNNLEKLLQRAANACWNATLPLEKFVSQSFQNAGLAENAPVMEKIDHYLTVLFFFRDDVHNSIWKGLGFDAHTWEVLTTIWRKETATLEGLIEALSHREFPRADTERSLSSLVEDGLAVKKKGGYWLSERGKELRETAEDHTEALYNAALLTLTKEEILNMRRLLKFFCSGLAKIQKNQESMH